eukprot:TRINITY_DN1785_c0_g1_i1.p1 TRINITY_DN1785_c0_g1~~TRINITY_DN1785_c0_g1_i1.p1  ORF type:complete len:1229 (-),score=579.91 TRINITY_DN1785_c0_g1_i1:127-3813(-)
MDFLIVDSEEHFYSASSSQLSPLSLDSPLSIESSDAKIDRNRSEREKSKGNSIENGSDASQNRGYSFPPDEDEELDRFSRGKVMRNDENRGEEWKKQPGISISNEFQVEKNWGSIHSSYSSSQLDGNNSSLLYSQALSEEEDEEFDDKFLSPMLGRNGEDAYVHSISPLSRSIKEEIETALSQSAALQSSNTFTLEDEKKEKVKEENEIAKESSSAFINSEAVLQSLNVDQRLRLHQTDSSHSFFYQRLFQQHSQWKQASGSMTSSSESLKEKSSNSSLPLHSGFTMEDSDEKRTESKRKSDSDEELTKMQSSLSSFDCQLPPPYSQSSSNSEGNRNQSGEIAMERSKLTKTSIVSRNESNSMAKGSLDRNFLSDSINIRSSEPIRINHRQDSVFSSTSSEDSVRNEHQNNNVRHPHFKENLHWNVSESDSTDPYEDNPDPPPYSHSESLRPMSESVNPLMRSFAQSLALKYSVIELPSYESATAGISHSHQAPFDLRITKNEDNHFTPTISPVKKQATIHTNERESNAKEEDLMFHFPEVQNVVQNSLMDSTLNLSSWTPSLEMYDENDRINYSPSNPLSSIISSSSSFSPSSSSSKKPSSFLRSSSSDLSSSFQKKQNKDPILQSIIQAGNETMKAIRQVKKDFNKSRESREKEITTRHAQETKILEQNQQWDIKMLHKERDALSNSLNAKLKEKTERKMNENVNLTRGILSNGKKNGEEENLYVLKGKLRTEDMQMFGLAALSQQKVLILERIKWFKERVSFGTRMANIAFQDDRREQKQAFNHQNQILERNQQIKLEELDERYEFSLKNLLRELAKDQKNKRKVFQNELKGKEKGKNKGKEDFPFPTSNRSLQENENKMRALESQLIEEQIQAEKRLSESISGEKINVVKDYATSKQIYLRNNLEAELKVINGYSRDIREKLKMLRNQITDSLDADFERLMVMLDNNLNETIEKTEEYKNNLVEFLNNNHNSSMEIPSESPEKRNKKNWPKWGNSFRFRNSQSNSPALERIEATKEIEKGEALSELSKHEAQLRQIASENRQQLDLLRQINRIEMEFVNDLERLLVVKQEKELEVIQFYFREEQRLSEFFFLLSLGQVELANLERSEVEERYKLDMSTKTNWTKETQRAERARQKHSRDQEISLQKVLEGVQLQNSQDINAIGETRKELDRSQRLSEQDLFERGKESLETLHNGFLSVWRNNTKILNELGRLSIIKELGLSNEL